MYNTRVSANAVIVRNDSILVVEFDDASGLHYDLPGGGIKGNESICDGLRREVKEETCADVAANRNFLSDPIQTKSPFVGCPLTNCLRHRCCRPSGNA